MACFSLAIDVREAGNTSANIKLGIVSCEKANTSIDGHFGQGNFNVPPCDAYASYVLN